MPSNRPVNLSLWTISFPIAAIASIAHRISGVVLFFGSGVLIYGFYQALASQQAFSDVTLLLQRTPAKITLFIILLALAFHTLAGIRHLLMDLGIGESLYGGRLSASLVFIATALSSIYLWLWIF